MRGKLWIRVTYTCRWGILGLSTMELRYPRQVWGGMRTVLRAYLSFRHAAIAAGLALAAPLPASAAASDAASDAALHAALAEQASGELRAFYAHRDQPLWIGADGRLGHAAAELVRLIETADADGLDPHALRVDELAAAVSAAQHDRSPAVLARAELALSAALAGYAEAMMREAAGGEMLYEHDVLRPIRPEALTVLRSAAEARSLESFVAEMGWMHPLYGQVRGELAAEPADPTLRRAAIASLERIKAIPAAPWSRHVLIDIASARLWMYEGGRPVDSMRIVVGKADTPTPMMAGYLRYAVLNPYWNVPENLVRQTIARNVLNQGVGYLKARGYEVLSGWEDDAEQLDPAKIDWRAVARGERQVVVRQKPSATNAMGSVKYEFPNPEGIFLHDTPDKALLLADARQFSNGCVRLEDAERLGRWLLGGAIPVAGADPERRIDLAQPVPIYITYLTVRSEDGRLALGTDPYGRDATGRSTLARVH